MGSPTGKRRRPGIYQQQWADRMRGYAAGVADYWGETVAIEFEGVNRMEFVGYMHGVSDSMRDAYEKREGKPDG